MRIRVPLALAALGVLGTAPVFAQDGTVKVSVDNAPVQFTGQQPINDRGHVMVPLRGVFEKMGAKVGYDAASHKVTAKSDKSSIELNVGSTEATVDGKPVSLDAPTKITNGSVLVPLRFVSESLGSSVKFDKASQTVVVDTSKTLAPSQGTPDQAVGSTSDATTAPPTSTGSGSSAATDPAPTVAAIPPVIINNNVPPAAPPVTPPAQATPAPVTPAPITPAPVTPAPQPAVTAPPPSQPVAVDPTPTGFAWATYLPYILGAFLLLGVLGWYLNRRGKTGQVIAVDDKK